jgi:plastocyanin
LDELALAVATGVAYSRSQVRSALATRTRVLAALAAGAASLALAAPAAAEIKTETIRYGPISIGAYQVLQNDLKIGIPKPRTDGFVTNMEVDVVDPDGSQVPINRVMLHHIVFTNLGSQVGEKHDGTCNTFTAFDYKTKIPAFGERFYAAGEERAKMKLPPGYGYPMKAADQWAMTLMLMNHRSKADDVFIEYKVTYDTAPQTPVTPYWLDVENCLADPVYSVPGGGRTGSTHTRSANWTVPSSGRIVAGLGHVHGGAKDLTLNRGGCELYRSRPTWGLKSHPFYNVKPVLHEPGPINMTGFTSASGFPVRAGERLRMDSNYDARLLHTRVMGIMVVFLAQDPAAAAPSGCSKPSDMQESGPTEPGRTTAPRFTVPLTGIGRNGKARKISKPPGKRVRVKSGARITVGDRFFSKPNLTLPAGGMLRWKFDSTELHNVTVANGPRGFASDNLNGARAYSKRLAKPGTYQLFCALHPVSMTQTVKVVRRKH